MTNAIHNKYIRNENILLIYLFSSLRITDYLTLVNVNTAIIK